MRPLYFNGEPIPDGVGVTGFTVTSPQVDFRTMDLPYRPGAVRVGKKYAVQLGLVLLGSSYEDNRDILTRLTRWCASDQEERLFLPGDNRYYLMAECQVFPAPDLNHLDREFTVQFTAHQPQFFAVAEGSVTTPDGSFGEFGTDFEVGGDFPAYPVLTAEVNGANDPEFRIDDKFVIISGEVSGLVVVDFEHETVTIDGETSNALVTIESDINITLSPGRHTLTAIGSAASLTWHEAKLWSNGV